VSNSWVITTLPSPGFEGLFEGLLARIPILTGAIDYREYHVLGFETSDALRVDFGPFVLLEGGVLATRSCHAPALGPG
jgi:hypothetical protein